jgi:segregation and condensation protein A
VPDALPGPVGAEAAAEPGRPEPAGDPAGSDTLIVQLDGFEGPLDLLLELARRQAVDLARISVLALAEQYLATIERVGIAATGLARAADWLVMAAWLTWLKSRLLLPKPSSEAREAERAGDILVDRLTRMARVRDLAAWLEARPQLGRDTFARGGAPEAAITVVSDLPALFRACLIGLGWEPPVRQPYVPPRPILWRVPDALARFRALLGVVPDDTDLARFLPPQLFAAPAPDEESAAALRCRDDLPLQRRGAVATTLLAALELARDAQLGLRQDEPFGPILVHAVTCGSDHAVAQASELAET